MKAKNIILTIILTFISVLGVQAQSILNANDSGLAIHGYDPVSYHQEKPALGMEDISVLYNGGRYLFKNEMNRNEFLKNPDKYVPAFGGWCAWAMLEGEKVDVDPERYKIVNGSTYLYYNTFFVDTLKKWNKLAKEKTEEELAKKAEDQWLKLMSM